MSMKSQLKQPSKVTTSPLSRSLEELSEGSLSLTACLLDLLKMMTTFSTKCHKRCSVIKFSKEERSSKSLNPLVFGHPALKFDQETLLPSEKPMGAKSERTHLPMLQRRSRHTIPISLSIYTELLQDSPTVCLILQTLQHVDQGWHKQTRFLKVCFCMVIWTNFFTTLLPTFQFLVSQRTTATFLTKRLKTLFTQCMSKFRLWKRMGIQSTSRCF